MKQVLSILFGIFLFTLGGMRPIMAEPPPTSTIPDWARMARVSGFDADPEMSQMEVLTLMNTREVENVSVLEVDSGLSFYMNDTKFDEQLSFLDNVANEAHQRNMQAVVYYPSLEVTTQNGETINETMYKEHPEWIQRGIDGSPNVFYGSQEVWVEPGMESAWMSPNTPYIDYYLNRIRQLAATNLDGVWVDVPIYLGTGASWAGAEPGAAEAFTAWSRSQGLGGSNGYQVPTAVNWTDPAFMAWIRWRHENLADFSNAIRQAAHEVNPQFMVVIENFPADYMDATEAGLDGTYRRSNENFLRVWEIDSVSNTQAMNWASIDEFSNKLTMYKWARAVDRENPSWAFSYGYQPLDAGLTIAAAVTSGVVPFEAQTPEMTLSVNSFFRERWFNFIQEHEQALLNTPRTAQVGVWYSSATRDYQDFPSGGMYGMYVTTTPPTNDPNWWSTEAEDSALPKPHLGGYRGAAHALIKLHVPFKVITDPGDPVGELSGIKFLWLPSVAAISDASAESIKDFVSNGGVVFATGETPGTMDELGNIRPNSVFQDLFNLTPAATPEERTNTYGQGIAIYNPDARGANLFASVGDLNKANEDLSTVEQLVRIHVQDNLVVDAPEGVHVEIGKASETKHHLYVINYSGLQQPLIAFPQNIGIDYRAPAGYRVASASVVTPDTEGQSGSLAIQQTADQYYGLQVNVDQFALITLTLAPEADTTPAPWPALHWLSPERQEAAESGMNFVLNSMRHADQSEPLSFGIYTNLLDDSGLTEIYAHGHHVTAEHMGLMLRASACMGDTVAYEQSYRYVNEVMADPIYHVVNWAIDRDRFQPLVEYDEFWKNANSPLDDMRVIRGLLDGPGAASLSEPVTLAKKLMTGLYWTSVTDRDHKTALDFSAYPEGLIGYAWDWSGTTEMSLNPPAFSTGIGRLTTDPIPTDYNNLYILGQAAKSDLRWLPVLSSSTDLLINAEIPAVPGLFYNGYEANGNWTGDFENRDTNHGQHIKVIQSLWIALHLARAATLEPDLLDATRRDQAALAAERGLTFFKNYYLNNGHIPEYLTVNGGEVPSCTGTNKPAGCLTPDEDNLLDGEARIYALLARLALLLNDANFSSILIEERILTDRISDQNDPRYGLIGASTTDAGDAEAWNILESVLTICQESRYNTPVSNQAPVASAQTVFLSQDSSVSITLSGSDLNNDPLTYQITSQPVHGTLSGTPPNLSYAADAGYAGSDSFTFKVNDGQYNSSLATVSITINPVATLNYAPVAIAQHVVTPQNSSIAILLTATDQNGDALTYNVLTQPTPGTLSGNPPNLFYTPPLGYTGMDSFTFSASDGQLSSNTETVNIEVQPTNNNSEISNYTLSLILDGDLSDWAGLQSFGADPDDVTGVNNKLDWLEAWMAHDDDYFYIAYRNDGPIDISNWWAWQIYIDTDNDPSTGYQFDSIGAEYHIEEGMIGKYTGNGETWLWQEQGTVASAINGNVAELRFPRAWIGNPASLNIGFFGENVAFSGGTTEDYYPDGWAQENAAVRFLHYTVESIPSTLAPPSTYYPQEVTVTTGSYDSGTMPDLVSVDNTTYDIKSAISGGSQVDWYATTIISESPDTIVQLKATHIGQYNIDGVSQDFYLYNFKDGLWELVSNSTLAKENETTVSGTIDSETSDYISSQGELRVRISGSTSGSAQFQSWSNALYWEVSQAAPTGSNTAPTADGQSVATTENSPLNIVLTATDQDGDALTYTVLTQPVNGTLSGSAPNLTYTPANGYSGSDSFTFKANDGQVDSNTATVNITVGAVNDAPVADGQSVATTENSLLDIVLTATDQDGDALTYTVLTQPVNGTLSGSAPNLTYTPANGYSGSDSFTFKANDGQVDSNTATVNITVGAVNDAPTADGQSVATTENSLLDIVLTATDQDGDALTYTVLTQPANGTLSGSAPNLTYTPADGYSGSDSFTFKANDGQVDSSTATVNITVGAVNDAPVADGQSVATTENSPLNIVLTATDQDGDALTYTVLTQPANGTLSGSAPNLTYTPANGYSGSDSFTFKANDGQVDSNTATVSITVGAVNDAPTAAFTSACTYLACEFTDQSSDSDGTVISWSWNFGDGNTTNVQNPNHTYAASGTYTVSLTVTDNDGANNNITHDVTVMIPAAPVTATYYPEGVTITTGTYDWGTLTSFLSADSDTYDINSAAVSGGTATDWYAETTISESPNNVTHIKVTHIGQYSKAGVSQEFYVYNFQDNSWELVNSSVVGNEDDVHVSYSIDSEFAKYISSEGKLRTRVRGFKSVSGLWSWSNALHWEISGVATTETNTAPFASFASVCTNLGLRFHRPEY